MPSTNATQTLLDLLRQNLQPEPPLPWGVGFSGGRDSTVLLWALAQLIDPKGLTALWVDHGWRPEDERAREAVSVAAFCSSLGVNLRRFEPPTVVVRTEAAAREHRYQCWAAFAAEFPRSPIFLAHHADDQAETILMRLLRGRSWQGLGGMPARRGVYHRPLLTARATLLAQVASDNQLPYHEDSTNGDLSLTRNFLRRRAIPLLSERFPRAIEALGELGTVWRQVEPRAQPDTRWRVEKGRAEVDYSVWHAWNRLERQAQLLAVTTKLAPTPLTRRFLEVLAAVEGRRALEGAGWRWSSDEVKVCWERVVPSRSKEYFMDAEPGRWYQTGAFRLRWTTQPESGSVFVPGPDPTNGLVIRSVAGFPLASAEGEWNKRKRRRRLGSEHPSRCTLLVQQGLVKAAVDPQTLRVLWSESQDEKLHKSGIFVKLEQRSDYERR